MNRISPNILVPKSCRKILTTLLIEIEKHDNAFGRSKSDELVVQDAILRETLFTDAVRFLYNNSGTPTAGMRQLVQKLSQLGVRNSLVTSKLAQNMYFQAGSGVRLSRFPGKPGRTLRVYQ